MRVSQLLHVMNKDDQIVIDVFDISLPFDKTTLYQGSVSGIKRDDPVNKMHVSSICAVSDIIFVLAEEPRKKYTEGNEEVSHG